MASTIVTKNSSTASAVPVAGDLTKGELAVNVTDKKLYTKDNGGSVVKLVGSLGNQEASAVAVTGGAIDGTTVGSTTAAAGAFTTLAASSNVTLSGGTANGVAYLNGSKVLTTGSALTFDGSTFAVNSAASIGANTAKTKFYSDSTYNGIFNGASLGSNESIYMGDGTQFFFAAGSERMRLTSTGLGIGTSSPAQKLHVSGGTRIADSTNSANYITIGSGNEAPYGNNSVVAQTGSFTIGTVAASTNLILLTSGTEKARIDSSGNLGLGVTPSAWGGNYKAMQFNGGSLTAYTTLTMEMWQNVYDSGVGAFKYITTSQATRYQQASGEHRWFNAPSGTAGNAITFTQAMTLDASGKLSIGTTSTDGNSGYGNITLNGTNGSIFDLRVGDTLSGRVWTPAANQMALYSQGASSTLLLGTNNTERARIDSSGNLLVGTTTNYGIKLAVKGGSGDQFILDNDGSQYTQMYWANNGTNKAYMWWDNTNTRFVVQSGSTGGVYVASGGTSWTAVSDERSKDIIEPITDAASKVATLRAVIGKYKTDEEGKRRSFLIAQDVLSSFPEAVDISNPDEFGLSYTDIIPLLVAAIKEQQTFITQLTSRIAALETK